MNDEEEEEEEKSTSTVFEDAQQQLHVSGSQDEEPDDDIMECDDEEDDTDNNNKDRENEDDNDGDIQHDHLEPEADNEEDNDDDDDDSGDGDDNSKHTDESNHSPEQRVDNPGEESDEEDDGDVVDENDGVVDDNDDVVDDDNSNSNSNSNIRNNHKMRDEESGSENDDSSNSKEREVEESEDEEEEQQQLKTSNDKGEETNRQSGQKNEYEDDKSSSSSSASSQQDDTDNDDDVRSGKDSKSSSSSSSDLLKAATKGVQERKGPEPHDDDEDGAKESSQASMDCESNEQDDSSEIKDKHSEKNELIEIDSESSSASSSQEELALNSAENKSNKHEQQNIDLEEEETSHSKDKAGDQMQEDAVSEEGSLHDDHDNNHFDRKHEIIDDNNNEEDDDDDDDGDREDFHCDENLDSGNEESYEEHDGNLNRKVADENEKLKRDEVEQKDDDPRSLEKNETERHPKKKVAKGNLQSHTDLKKSPTNSRTDTGRRSSINDDEEGVRCGEKQAKKHEEDEEETDSPIKHITFQMSAKSSKSSKTIPKDLDEKTLQNVKSYILAKGGPHYNFDTSLNDDEVATFLVRMTRLASRQAEYHHRLVGDSTLQTDEQLFHEILADEEEYTIGQAFFKRIINGARKQNPDDHLDQKTINWIKRAAGLHRGKTEAQVRESAIAGSRPNTSKTVMKTRTAARRDKYEQRDQVLRAFTEAIDDLEKEFGPFHRRNKRRRSPSPPGDSWSQNDNDGNNDRASSLDTKKQRNSSGTGSAASPLYAAIALGPKRPFNLPPLPRPTRVLRATIRRRRFFPGQGTTEDTETDIVISTIIVDGQRIGRSPSQSTSVGGVKRTLPTTPNDLNRGKKERAPLSEAGGASAAKASNQNTIKATPHLRSLDWQCRKSALRTENRIQDKLETIEMHSAKMKMRPRVPFEGTDIIYRPPRWTGINRVPTNLLDPPRLRHPDDVYASFSSKLTNSLYGPNRFWAICEFYYGDLDRAWYTRNEFLEKAIELGVDPAARLMRHEWKAIRRRIQRKPRRFSSAFVTSQLNERNKCRNAIRKLQRNPLLAIHGDLSFEVPAIIRPGTIVTALSRRYRIIQRGVVLSYDKFRSRYLILFENRLYGCEYCPDSEVATHGGPRLLARKTSNKLHPLIPAQTSVDPPPPIGGARLLEFDGDLTVENELEKCLRFKPLEFPTVGVRPETTKRAIDQDAGKPDVARATDKFDVKDAAEREALVTLLNLVHMATRRKEILLIALEEMNSSMALNLPFGDMGDFEEYDKKPKATPELNQHYAWLLANLQETNLVLDQGLKKMRMLYGKAYLSYPVLDESKDKRRFVTKSFETQLKDMGNSSHDLSYPWAVSILNNSEYIATKMTVPTTEKPECDDNEELSEGSLNVKERLKTVRKSLLSLSCTEKLLEETTDHTPVTAVITAVENELLSSPQIPGKQLHGENQLHSQVKVAHSQAMEDLKAAFKLLKSEVSAASVKNRCNSGT